MPDNQHLKLLLTGATSWNAWRANEPSIRPDLRDADLLRKRLDGFDFRGADLRGAVLSCAESRSSNFEGADLTDADLSHGVFNRSSFRLATMKGVDLTKAKLKGCNFGGAKLESATLIDADLMPAYPLEDQVAAEREKEMKTWHEDARLWRAASRRAQDIGIRTREEVEFTADEIARKACAPARMDCCLLERADLTRARLDHVELSGARLVGAVLVDANLSGANATDANFTQADLSGACVCGADFLNATLTDANITSVDFSEAQNRPEQAG
jgi:uncharacterized protein YjbI with pentapeptide repeats